MFVDVVASIAHLLVLRKSDFDSSQEFFYFLAQKVAKTWGHSAGFFEADFKIGSVIID